MFSRFSPGDVLELLAEFTRRADGVIIPQDGEVVLTSPSQPEHLPEDLGSWVVVPVACEHLEA